MVRRPGVEDVRRAFLHAGAAEPDRAGAPPGVSAVLLPLRESAEGACELLFTRRARTLRSHAGEMSFPGGRVDPTDAHPLAAALREAEEEIGLAPRDVSVLGHLTDFLTYRDVLVCAYVGVVSPDAPEPVARSREEVEEVIPVPVAHLLDEARYEARAIAGMGEGRRVHYWHLPRCTVWGITGELTARFLERAWAWRAPERVRTVDDLSHFRPEALPPHEALSSNSS